MATIHMLNTNNRRPRIVDTNDEPPDNSGMEARVTKLEDFAIDTRDRLSRIETRLDTFTTIFATKEDLHKEITASTRWFVGWVTGVGVTLVAAVYFIAKNVH
jgi:tetrahydromethanopterin S-methyltransferase subunit B